jgi:hypothetical protein
MQLAFQESLPQHFFQVPIIIASLVSLPKAKAIPVTFFSTKDLCPNFITKATKLQSSGVYIHSSVAPAPTPTKTKIPSGGASTQGYASTQSSNDKTKRHKTAPPAEHNPKAAQTQQNTQPTNSL